MIRTLNAIARGSRLPIRRQAVIALIAVLLPVAGQAAGTIAGTDITNTAEASYEIGGTPVTQSSNTVTISVDEIIDATLVLQSPRVVVATPESNAVLLFSLTNTGNGPETFSLTVANNDAGDDFDPIAAATGIFFDTDGSGDLSVGDEAYVPGTNDPLLAADASVAILVVNDIPPGLTNGDIGRSILTATAATGSGAPGTVYPGAGTNGVNAVVGTSGASVSATGEYIVSDVRVAIAKSALVTDPFGGSEPVPGATITYSITVEVTGTGTAIALIVDDAIPADTSYTLNSITFNGVALSDAADGDAGFYDATAGNERVVVQIGDLNAASGLQTVVFSVTID